MQINKITSQVWTDSEPGEEVIVTFDLGLASASSCLFFIVFPSPSALGSLRIRLILDSSLTFQGYYAQLPILVKFISVNSLCPSDTVIEQ